MLTASEPLKNLLIKSVNNMKEEIEVRIKIHQHLLLTQREIQMLMEH
jgi:hypothetical protein